MLKLPVVLAIVSITDCHFQTTYRCAYCDRPVGQKFFKPWTLMAASGAPGASGAWIQSADGVCVCPRSGRTRTHTSLMVDNASGTGRTGRPDLMAQSQAYPLKFGEAIVLSWLGDCIGARALQNKAGCERDEFEPGCDDEAGQIDALLEQRGAPESPAAFAPECELELPESPSVFEPECELVSAGPEVPEEPQGFEPGVELEGCDVYEQPPAKRSRSEEPGRLYSPRKQ